MQVIGAIHLITDPTFPAVMRYLSRLNWKGVTVAFEHPSSIEQIFAHPDGEPDIDFSKAVIRLIQQKGGNVVTVENARLYWRAIRLRNRLAVAEPIQHETFKEIAKRERAQLSENAFLRTIRMIHQASKAGATVLITGADHAANIKTILGKKANVRIILPANRMKENKERYAFVKEMKNSHIRKEIEALFQPALRVGRKLKRPRMREQNRIRRSKRV